MDCGIHRFVRQLHRQLLESEELLRPAQIAVNVVRLRSRVSSYLRSDPEPASTSRWMTAAADTRPSPIDA